MKYDKNTVANLPKVVIERGIGEVIRWKYGTMVLNRVMRNCEKLEYIKLRDQLMQQLRRVLQADGSKHGKKVDNVTYGLIHKLVSEDIEAGEQNNLSAQMIEELLKPTEKDKKQWEEETGLIWTKMSVVRWNAAQCKTRLLCREDRIRQLMKHIIATSNRGYSIFCEILKNDMKER